MLRKNLNLDSVALLVANRFAGVHAKVDAAVINVLLPRIMRHWQIRLRSQLRGKRLLHPEFVGCCPTGETEPTDWGGTTRGTGTQSKRGSSLGSFAYASQASCIKQPAASYQRGTMQPGNARMMCPLPTALAG